MIIMKKFIIALLAVALVAAALCVSVSASTADDVIAYARSLDSAGQIPEDVYSMAEGVLRQVPISAEQAENLKAVINQVRESVPTYRGMNAEVYTDEEVAAVFEGIDEASEILKVNVAVEEVAGDEDIAVRLTYNNNEVGVIDFDAIKETGSSFENTALVVASVVCVLGAAAFVAVAMKKKACEN